MKSFEVTHIEMYSATIWLLVATRACGVFVDSPCEAELVFVGSLALLWFR
jgi:hypothetical protein